MKRVKVPLRASQAATAIKSTIHLRSGTIRHAALMAVFLLGGFFSFGQDKLAGTGNCDNPVPFPCDGTGYISSGIPTKLYRVNTDIVPYTATEIVLNPADTYTFNAIGFNPVDGFIYAWTPDETLLRIDANGDICAWPNPGGHNLPSKAYVAGAFDQFGRFYFKNDVDNGNVWNFPIVYDGSDPDTLLEVEAVNAFGMSPTLKQMADIAVSFFDSTLYGMINVGMNLGKLGVLDLTTSPADASVKDVMNLPIQEYGTAWIDGQNRLFVANDAGTLYRIDDPTLPVPVADTVSLGQPLGINHDGTSCGFFPAFTKEVDPDSTAYGQIVTYTYKIGISLPGEATFEFTDDLRSLDDFAGTMMIDESATPVPGKYIPGTFSISGGTGTAIFSNGDSVLRIDPVTATGPTVVTIEVDVFTEFLQMETNKTWYNQAFLDSLETDIVTAPFPDSILSDDPQSPFFPYPTALYLFNALPISLTDFHGEAANCQARLVWTTESEENVSHYEVLTSEDGYKFDLLGKVPSVGFSSSEQQYEIMDDRVETMKYYKLRAVDFDGNSELFDIISVLPDCDGQDAITVAPNPSNGQDVKVGFKADMDMDISISIIDATGKAITVKHVAAFEGMNTYNFSAYGLARGMYQVVITTKYGNTMKPVRFIHNGN